MESLVLEPVSKQQKGKAKDMNSSPWIDCPVCHSQNKRGEQVCFACGKALVSPTSRTAISQHRSQVRPDAGIGERVKRFLWDVGNTIFNLNTRRVIYKRYTEEELRNEQWEKYKKRHLME